MAKYYVESGPVRLIFDARSPIHAAVKAFEWTCRQQDTIETDCPVEHALEADRRGWQLDDLVFINERGFGRPDALAVETVDVLMEWQFGDWSEATF